MATLGDKLREERSKWTANIHELEKRAKNLLEPLCRELASLAKCGGEFDSMAQKFATEDRIREIQDAIAECESIIQEHEEEESAWWEYENGDYPED